MAQPRSGAHSLTKRCVTCGQGVRCIENTSFLEDRVNRAGSSSVKSSTVLPEISKYARQIKQYVSKILDLSFPIFLFHQRRFLKYIPPQKRVYDQINVGKTIDFITLIEIHKAY